MCSAGLNSDQVRKATVVSWMEMGVFKTRQTLAKMKLAKSDACLVCDKSETENLSHLLLYCEFYAKIREEYLPKLTLLNANSKDIMNNEDQLISAILNPQSKNLPESARLHCDSAFALSRSYCYDIYRKREKFYEIKT